MKSPGQNICHELTLRNDGTSILIVCDMNSVLHCDRKIWITQI